jgi:hypothetical protein
MSRILLFLLVLTASVFCSKKDNVQPPAVIPDIINGLILEVDVTPINITTPDRGTLLVVMNSTIYKVDFNAVAQSQSNATLFFDTDSILRPESTEFANLGKDAIAYNPVGPNEITIQFYDGRKVFGFFDPNTSFGGTFGEQLISQWRNPSDPAKPNQKARDDISNFVTLYSDNNGPAPGIIPIYLLAQVSKQ